MSYVPCEICGMPACDRHHVVSGTANRRKSEYWGMAVYLCRNCHTLIHSDYLERVRLCQKYQQKFEDEHSHELWMQEFMRNYL